MGLNKFMSEQFGMYALVDDDANEVKRKAQQRKRSIAIGWVLFAMVVMFYVTAWLRFGGIVSGN